MTPSGGSVANVGQVQPTYDAAGNVASVTTSLGAIPGVTTGGSETQAFCSDEQDRLVWASTQSTGSCGRAGSEGITGASYTASYAYDPVGRLASQSVTTSGGSGLAGAAQGSYSYGDAAHVHAVTAVGSGGTTSYSAAYDAAGDMTCRGLDAYTCDNNPATRQSMTYDALWRLIAWQNGSSSSEQYAYDGEGTRVWRQTTSGSTTTTTVSILGVEDVTLVSGGATTATRYYRLPGGVTATRDSSGLVYEASDQLGTPVASLNLSTGIVGEQLRAPYGQPRYAATGTGSSGGMRTPYGFTGQREDTTPSGASGLDDFHARMYDAETGRFTSADDAQPGLGDPGGQDGYAYVGGMVEQATDPSGHAVAMRLETQAGDALAIVGAAAAVVAAIYLADWLNTHRDDLAVNQGILNASAASAAAAALAGTLPTATAVMVRQGSNVSITLAPDGTITVTTTIPGSAYGGTSTVYAPGQPGYLDYIHAFDAPTSAGDLPLNQATDRPTASANTVTGSSSSVAGAGTTAGAGAVGTPPSTIQPGVPSAAASALATTVATAGTLVGTWYAFAKQSKGGSNTAANKRARQVAKEFGCDPDTDPECYEDFMDALHNYKGKSGRGGADHWPIERLRAFAREYFEGDPDAWQIYDP